MARFTINKTRELQHILHTPNLLRKILGPLDKALRCTLSVEKEKSWFPKFPMLAHILCGIFFQISQHRSMRELLTVISLKIQNSAFCGFKIIRSTFSDANNSRRRLKVIRNIFANLVEQAEVLPHACRKFARIAALDSSLLHCVPSSEWAEYRKKVNACKAHLLFDLSASIPKKLILSIGKLHDRKFFKQFLVKGWTYIVDRAYNDYTLFDEMNLKKIYFVTRLKSNACLEVVKKRKIKRKHKKSGVLSDSIIVLGNGVTRMETELRIVEYKTDEGKIYKFLTNRFDLTPVTIAQLYHARWAIETFFKWLKRTLSMEQSLGRSEIGLEIHVLITLITDILLKLLAGVKKNYQHIPVTILRIIRENLFNSWSATLLLAIKKVMLSESG